MTDDRAQYEFKPIRVLRGTESRAIAKWQSEGWDLDSERPGRVRTELVFRRVRPKTVRDHLVAGLTAFRSLRPSTQRGVAFGSLGLIAAIAVAAVAVGGHGEKAELKPAAQSTALAAAPTQASVATPSVEAASPAPTASAPAALTAKNSEELAAVLRVGDPGDDKVARFAQEHAGETIAFNASIRSMLPHGGYKTRYDILIAPGDFDPDSERGPSFQFENVNTVSDLHFTGGNIPDTIGVGDNVRVVAEVGDYDPDSELFHLIPVSTRFRD